jgi:predicted deacylase
MSENTLIRSDIDFDRNGKQSSFLSVPISTNESAYGSLTIPVTVLKNGDGPTISFTGGVHGDEYEGPVTLMKLTRSLNADEINGRVIIIPSLNLPAVLSGNRCSPIDGLNLNRVFPGKANGTVTEMIAHFITSEIVPRSDLHVDLHSGGKTLEYIPCIFVPHGATQEARQEVLDTALSFGTDLAITQDDSFPDSGRFLSAMFSSKGKPAYTCELAGAGRVSPGVVKMAEYGVRNIMQHIGILQGQPFSNQAQGREATRQVTVPHSDCYVIAPDDGLYEPFVELGDPLATGQEIGQVHYPQHHQKDPWKVISGQSGFLLCKRPPGKVQRGDNIAIIATVQP